MKSYIISLNKPKKLISQLFNYGFEPILFNGINAKTVDLDTIKQHFNSFWFNIGPLSALGCAMSHLNVWKTFVETKNKHCLIVEDDVIFAPTFSIKKTKKIILNTPADFDILYMGCFNSTIFQFLMKLLFMNKLNTYDDNHKLVKNTDVALATHAYILSRKGAVKLIKLLDHNINNHIDFCLQRLNKTNLIKSYTVKNKLIHQISTDSMYKKNIHSNNVVNKHPVLIQKFFSKIYMDKHITYDYLFTVSFMQVGPFTFNLTSILFLLFGILTKNNNNNIIVIILLYLTISIPDLITYSFKSTFLHLLLLILPYLF